MGAIGVTAPQIAAPNGLTRRRLGAHLRDMLFGLALTLFLAAMVYAEEMPQDWVPDVLSLPPDAEIEMDRAIGSSIRMFSFRTAADAKELLRAWSEALANDGYNIRPQQTELEETAIEFSGGDILNAKIATDPASGDGKVVITFDATIR